MTIFRRCSKNTVDQTPDLEASTSASAYWLADFDDKDNVVVISSGDEAEDTSSTCTNYSNSSNDDSITTVECSVGEALVQAFSDFSVKLDPNNENVLVSVNLPSEVPAEDLNVKVDEGILRVSASHDDDASLSARSMVEQSFQLDEQSLDIKKVTAQLSASGLLTITAPKKTEQNITLMDHLSIRSQRPPKDPMAFRVILDVPGVHLEDLHVSYANGKLRVAGNRHFGRVRSFKRTMTVDTQKYNADKIKCYLYRGQLTIVVPTKKKASVSRMVEIQEEEEEDGLDDNETLRLENGECFDTTNVVKDSECTTND